MEPIRLSLLVNDCRQYYPLYNWYYCKSKVYICGAVKTPGTIGYDVIKLDALNSSPDYVLMPECPGMTDDEAAVVVKWWCRQNNIPYNDDMDNIEATYPWYYKYEDENDNYEGAIWHFVPNEHSV